MHDKYYLKIAIKKMSTTCGANNRWAGVNPAPTRMGHGMPIDKNGPQRMGPIIDGQGQALPLQALEFISFIEIFNPQHPVAQQPNAQSQRLTPPQSYIALFPQRKVFIVKSPQVLVQLFGHTIGVASPVDVAGE